MLARSFSDECVCPRAGAAGGRGSVGMLRRIADLKSSAGKPMNVVESSPSPLNGERAGVRGAIDPEHPHALRALPCATAHWRADKSGVLARNSPANERLLTPALSSRGGEGEDSATFIGFVPAFCSCGSI